MPSIKVNLPLSLKVSNAITEITVDADNVYIAIQKVANAYPEIKDRLFTSSNELAPWLVVFLNERKIIKFQAKTLMICEGDELDLIFALAGGEEINEQGRYARQIILNEIGIQGQENLKNSRVLIIGTGGLGSPTLIYLAAAGIGMLGIVDGDTVDQTNLARQVLFTQSDLGKSKVQSAAQRLRQINPYVSLELYDFMINSENAIEIAEKYDLVITTADNYAVRYVMNDACVKAKKRLIDVAVKEFYGQIAVFQPGCGCYSCLFPQAEPTLADSQRHTGVIGALCGHMGAWAAMEAIKVLLGRGEENLFSTYDALKGTHKRHQWDKNVECPVCATL